MRRPLSMLVWTLLASAAWGALAAPPGQAQISYAPCKGTNQFACAHVTVPLDPTGATPGTISLSLRRHRAPVGESPVAIVALAGGPGQAALGFAEQFAEVLGPVATTRDMLVFDQRGTGQSHPLSCHAFERVTFTAPGSTIATCATQIGAERAFFTTANSVADIEAIRQAGGYEKLVLYGTSYGTKVAEEYAQAHPERVAALVLDSVVPPSGPEPFALPTFEAIPRVLRQLCARHLCDGITREPVADLGRLLARIARRPLRVRTLLAGGSTTRVSITAEGLFEMLLLGDFSGLLRAETLTDVSAAARGDDAALARLYRTVHGSEGASEEDFDLPLFFTTLCEEEAFPWRRAATPAARLAEGLAAIHALPASDFAPFTARDAFALSDLPSCAQWPFASAAPPATPSAMPDVPTLILSGADDLRTPTSGAQQVAAAIPGAKLLVVPYTGHSVLSGEPGSCASEALQAFFASEPVKPCRATPAPTLLRPPPRPPRSLAHLASLHGYRGLTGRTLQAIRLTLADIGRQLALQFGAAGIEQLLSPRGIGFGALRAGWARFGRGGLVLHDYSFVPGVTLSGKIKAEVADVVVSGSADAHGTLKLGAHGALVGDLAGQPVRLPASSIASAAIVGEDAASQLLDPRRPDGRRVPGGLARLIGWLLDA